jgi:molybdopterin-containing oxidoreductase family iron-sulfur binding subunit
VEDDSASPPSRRDFLRIAGFAALGASLAGCQRAPVQHALSYVNQPGDFVPGRSYSYASTCGGCSAGCGLLATTRDGRPIKLEGNPEHPLARGGLCAVGQASLLGLYDSLRLEHPRQNGRDSEWLAIDTELRARLDDIRKQGGAVRFLTGSQLGPTTRVLIQKFLGTFADARHVVYDPSSSSAIRAAHARTHGVRVLPHYRLDKADTIVSFDADFLGRWISPVEFAAAYRAGRTLDDAAPRMSYHAHFESRLSLTGSKADERFRIAPGEIGSIVSGLASLLAKKAGVAVPEGATDEASIDAGVLDRLAERLWHDRGRSLILCDSQDVDVQVLCNFLNHILGNYGTTVDVAQPSLQQRGDDGELQTLLRELHDGKVSALFTYQCNPVYDLPNGESLAGDLKRRPLLVSFAERLDETAGLAHFVCPVPHYLESWDDAEPVAGIVSLVQPAIAPRGDTRSVMESLNAWMGKPQSAYDLLRAYWEKEVFPRFDNPAKQSFQTFWDRTLHDGFAQVTPPPSKIKSFDVSKARLMPPRAAPPAEGTFALVLYAKVGMPDAGHAYNPWLQELPDPISKVTWDNYACLSPASAARLGVSTGDVVRLEGGSAVLELPALVQPGQHDGVIAVALGYGSRSSERFAAIGPRWLEAKPTLGNNGLVGVNAAPLLTWAGASLQRVRDGVRLTKTSRQHPLAPTQHYDLLDVPPRLALPGQQRRPIIHETTLEKLTEPRPSGSGEQNHSLTVAAQTEEPKADLWVPDHATNGPHWGMAIDLSACTGCSACVIACQVENNIPTVGKDEVHRQREMHWLRIDRYYTEKPDGVDVAYQPMLCQHCGNAPCEVVCPVLATVHSEEGLNQQVYNRCVGTRYCANNCPYKVRRFNWFDYAHDDSLHNLVLNPDVTVRSRGVMEKCTFCVQRIQEAKIEAGRQELPVSDGDIRTACQQSCPAQAIVFGDLNDPKSRVSRLAAGPRAYRVLEELNVKPSVNYLSVVRNRPAAAEDKRHG